MNRFRKSRTEKKGRTQIYVPVLVSAVMIGWIWSGITSISAGTGEQQKASLEEALHRDIVMCYAQEGRYPQSLDYLKKNYGLHYDVNRYFVDYQPLGSNILPEVTIIRRGGSK